MMFGDALDGGASLGDPHLLCCGNRFLPSSFLRADDAAVSRHSSNALICWRIPSQVISIKVC